MRTCISISACMIYMYIFLYREREREYMFTNKSTMYLWTPKSMEKWRFLSPQNMGCVVLTPQKLKETMGSHGWYLPDSPDSPDPHRCQTSENLKNNGQFLLGAPSENFSMWNARRFWDGMVSVCKFGKKRQCNISRLWFQTCFIFIPIWGRFPFWQIFFKWVETTN